MNQNQPGHSKPPSSQGLECGLSSQAVQPTSTPRGTTQVEVHPRQIPCRFPFSSSSISPPVITVPTRTKPLASQPDQTNLHAPLEAECMRLPTRQSGSPESAIPSCATAASRRPMQQASKPPPDTLRPWPSQLSASQPARSPVTRPLFSTRELRQHARPVARLNTWRKLPPPCRQEQVAS